MQTQDFNLLAPIQLCELLELKCPDYQDYLMEVHSPSACTVVLQDAHGEIIWTRWSYGASGRWTLIPLD